MNKNFSNNDNYLLLFWLYSLFVLVFLMIVIGGITRITDSGLSMVEWRLIYGVLPPISNDEWKRVFELYKNTPEYFHYNNGMTLSEFKYIFFWEYFHRLWGRLIGIVFIIPLAYFLVKKKISKEVLLKLILILSFGIFQAFLGWWMVESGLHENPDVSQYRLAIHLSNALIILFLIYWLILDIKLGKSKLKINRNSLIFAFITLTIIAGAIVAGMDAGLMYNTYPLMNEKFLPDDYFSLGFLDPFENPGSAQFHHRHLGLISMILVIVFYYLNFKDTKIVKLLNVLVVLIIFQFILGVIILLNYVPNFYASLHQIGAILIFITFIKILHSQGTFN